MRRIVDVELVRIVARNEKPYLRESHGRYGRAEYLYWNGADLHVHVLLDDGVDVSVPYRCIQHDRRKLA